VINVSVYRYADPYVSCVFVCPLTYLNKSSAVAEMGDRLATIERGRKHGTAKWGPSKLHETFCTCYPGSWLGPSL